jgi:hypothetical protein
MMNPAVYNFVYCYQLVYISGSQPGVRVPLGVGEKVTGVRKIKKKTQKKPVWVEFLIWG